MLTRLPYVNTVREALIIEELHIPLLHSFVCDALLYQLKELKLLLSDDLFLCFDAGLQVFYQLFVRALVLFVLRL